MNKLVLFVLLLCVPAWDILPAPPDSWLPKLISCMDGPGVLPTAIDGVRIPPCLVFDWDGDFDVDLFDFAEFQNEVG